MNVDYPLAFRIKSLNNMIKRLMERTAITENDANLTGNQYAILGFLGTRNGEETFQKDIEAEFNIRRSTATGMLQLLEKEEYIRRECVPNDARLKKIILTPKAIELDKIAKTHILELQKRLTKGISSAELEEFYRILDIMIQNAGD